MRLSRLFLALLLSACSTDLKLPDDVEVECRKDADCPPDWVCWTGVNRCAPKGTDAQPTLSDGPSVEVDLATRVGSTITVPLTVRDQEGQTVTLEAAWSDGGDFVATTVTPQSVEATPEGVEVDVVWDAAAARGTDTYAGDIVLRITPNDGNDPGPSIDVGPLAHGNDAPVLSAVSLDDSVVTGLVVVRFSVADSATDPVNLTSFQLSLAGDFSDAVDIPTAAGPGTAFVAGATAGIITSVDGSERFVVWNSREAGALSADAAKVRLQVSDGDLASAVIESEAFRLANGNDAPVIESVTLDDALVRGEVVVRMQLRDEQADRVDLTGFEFSASGDFDDTVEVPLAEDSADFPAGAVTSIPATPAVGEHFVVWDSSVSAPVFSETARIRVTVDDGELSSEPAISAAFTLSNRNDPPVLTDVSLDDPVVRGTVVVRMQLSDSFGDAVDIEAFEVSLSGNFDDTIAVPLVADGPDFVAGSLTGIATGETPSEHFIVWDSAASVPLSSETARIRLRVGDGELSSPLVESPVFELANANEAPVLSDVVVDGEPVTGLAVVRFVASDSSDVSVSVASFELSLDGTFEDTIVVPATDLVAGAVDDIVVSPNPSEQFFVWDSSASAAFTSDAAQVRLTLTDGQLSSETIVSPTFHLLNQTPALVVGLASGAAQLDVATGALPITYNLIDNEADAVDVRVRYSTDRGVNWFDATEYPAPPSGGRQFLATSPSTDGGVKHTFLWDTMADVFFPADAVMINVVPAERHSGQVGSGATIQLANGGGPLADARPFGDAIDLGNSRSTASAIGDLDQDGINELVVSNWRTARGGSNQVRIHWGEITDGEWSNTEQTNLGLSAGAYGVQIADFDADGTLDIAVALNRNPAQVVVYLGEIVADEWTHTQQTFEFGNGATAMQQGDLNGDGITDLAVATFSGKRVHALIGSGSAATGDWTMTMDASFGTQAANEFLTVADLDNDGRLDFVANQDLADAMSLGFGAGSAEGDDWTIERTRSEDVCAVGMANILAGDFNGDGFTDLIVGCDFDQELHLRTGDGTGAFVLAASFSTAAEDLESLAAADFNGDGLLDVLAGYSSGNQVAVHLASSTPEAPGVGFSTPITIDVGEGYFVDSGDINGDGNADIIYSELGSGSTGRLYAILSRQERSLSAVFADPLLLDGGSPSAWLALGDLNSDGRVDVVTGDEDADAGGIYYSFGADAATEGLPFTSPSYRSADGRGLGVATGDFGNDDTIDAIAVSFQGLYYMRGRGDDGIGTGSFQSANRRTTNSYTYAVAAEVTGDGRMDLLLGDGPVVGEGTGGGRFNFNGVGSGEAEDIDVVDMDGDGIRDLVLAYSRSLGVFIGGGSNGVNDGTFEAPITWPNPNSSGTVPIGDLAVADLNDDGINDVVAVYSGTVRVYMGSGSAATDDWTLTQTQEYGFGGNNWGLELVDLDTDGAIDLVLSNIGSNNVRLVRGIAEGGLGTGTFADAVEVISSVGSSPRVPRLIDANGDHTLDLLLPNSQAAQFTLLTGRRLNPREPWTQPMIAAASVPVAGAAQAFGFAPQIEQNAFGDDTSYTLGFRQFAFAGTSGPIDGTASYRSRVGRFIDQVRDSSLAPLGGNGPMPPLTRAWQLSGLYGLRVGRHAPGDEPRHRWEPRLGVADENGTRAPLDLEAATRTGIVVDLPIIAGRDLTLLDSMTVRVFARTLDYVRAGDVEDDALHGLVDADDARLPLLDFSDGTRTAFAPRSGWEEIDAASDGTFPDAGRRFWVDSDHGVVRVLTDRDLIVQAFLQAPSDPG